MKPSLRDESQSSSCEWETIGCSCRVTLLITSICIGLECAGTRSQAPISSSNLLLTFKHPYSYLSQLLAAPLILWLSLSLSLALLLIPIYTSTSTFHLLLSVSFSIHSSSHESYIDDEAYDEYDCNNGSICLIQRLKIDVTTILLKLLTLG